MHTIPPTQKDSKPTTRKTKPQAMEKPTTKEMNTETSTAYGNGDCSYKSDLSSSSDRSCLDGYLPTNGPTSSSSSESDIQFSSDEDGWSEEGVEETIDFIRKKQAILKRAVDVLFDQEEDYDAATARATSRMEHAVLPPGSLWTQAKRVNPQKKNPSKGAAPSRRSTCGPNRGEKKTVQPNPRDLQINLGEVGHVSSGSFDQNAASADDRDTDTSDGLPEVAFAQGQWMAQALIRCFSTFPTNTPADPNECRWKVVSDPVTCCLGLVPPPSVSMDNSITIADALKFSKEGHILTQATPPFCVVYVNKAFMLQFGLTSKESLIGKPVESFLQVSQDIMDSPKAIDETDDFIRAQLLKNQVSPPIAPEDDSGDENQAPDSVHCRMMVVPVMDRGRRRRLMPNSRQMRRFSCMSHVLVRIHESDHAISPSSSMVNVQLDDLLAVSDSDRPNKDDDSSSSSAGEASIRSNMVETVG